MSAQSKIYVHNKVLVYSTDPASWKVTMCGYNNQQLTCRNRNTYVHYWTWK